MSKDKQENEDQAVYKITPLGFLTIRLSVEKDNMLKFVELVKVD